MIITCPKCSSRYKIDPANTTKDVVRVKCPGCQHLFNVPIAAKETAGQSAVSPDAEGLPTVLVVDDARFFREMIAEILNSLPVNVMTVEDGIAAWRQIRDRAPHLLLLDLNIPGKSGYELLKDIQQSPELSHMKILVMSGALRGDQVSSEVSRLGADGFINKSFTPKEIQNRVCQTLGL